jgi:hypothetical protein
MYTCVALFINSIGVDVVSQPWFDLHAEYFEGLHTVNEIDLTPLQLLLIPVP